MSCQIYLLACDWVCGKIILHPRRYSINSYVEKGSHDIIMDSISASLPLKIPSMDNIEPMTTMAKKQPYQLPPPHQLFTFNHDPDDQQPNLYDAITIQCVLAYLQLDEKNGDEVETKFFDEKMHQDEIDELERRQQKVFDSIKAHNCENIDEEILEKVKALLDS